MRRAVAVLVAVALVPVGRAAGAPAVQCAAAPSSATPDYVVTIGAAGAPPATTPLLAVLDSGVDDTQPEFAGKLRDGTNTVDGSGTRDADGHGTAVAGIAAGSSSRLRGVSPTTPLMVVKIFDDSGATSTDALVKGIDAAVAAGARTINISAAAPVVDAPPDAERLIGAAIDRAVSADVVVVASAGNEGAGSLDVPARYPHVLVAGALEDRAPASFSNFGPGLDVLAPGSGLIAPAPNAVCFGGYALASGTSFAAPVVAGAAAWLSGANPALTATQRADLLRSSAADVGAPGWDVQSGFGRLDLAAALAAKPPAAEPEVDDDPFWVSGRYAARHPRLVYAHRRQASVSGSIAFHDPADVARVGVPAGRRLLVTVSSPSPIGAGIWDDRAGRFAVTGGSTHGRVASRTGAGTLRMRSPRARHAGTWFVGVTAVGAPAVPVAYTLTVRLAS